MPSAPLAPTSSQVPTTATPPSVTPIGTRISSRTMTAAKPSEPSVNGELAAAQELDRLDQQDRGDGGGPDRHQQPARPRRQRDRAHLVLADPQFFHGDEAGAPSQHREIRHAGERGEGKRPAPQRAAEVLREKIDRDE